MEKVGSDPMPAKVSSDPMTGRTVRVTVPAKAYYNLGQMREITGLILERLGCPNCHSGRDIRFRLEEDLFVVEGSGGGLRVTGLGER